MSNLAQDNYIFSGSLRRGMLQKPSDCHSFLLKSLTLAIFLDPQTETKPFAKIIFTCTKIYATDASILNLAL